MDSNVVGAWFLGPKAENEEELLSLLSEQFRLHCEWRRVHFPQDVKYITEKEVKASAEYKEELDKIRGAALQVAHGLHNNQPFFSSRYKGHMNSDIFLTSILGYFATMLYNPNNVAAELSPYTNELERQVGEQLCRLIGYSTLSSFACTMSLSHATNPHPPSTKAAQAAPSSTDSATSRQETSTHSDDSPPIFGWGHITADGTIANIESLWAARNVRYGGLALQKAIRSEATLERARGVTVTPVTGGERVHLLELDEWQVVNLPMDTVLRAQSEVNEKYGISPQVLHDAVTKYDVQHVGVGPYQMTWKGVVFVSATRHYSLDKAVSLLGIGQHSMRTVPVDELGRMDLAVLECNLRKCLEDKVPVISVVAIIGTTAEGAVDDLEGIHSLRSRLRHSGLDFYIHADAAWGGYFRTMLIAHPDTDASHRLQNSAHTGSDDDNTTLHHGKLTSNVLPSMFFEQIPLSAYVERNLRNLSLADSVTVDPHKSGFIQYPAGSLSYRNGDVRHFLSFSSSYISCGENDPSMGIFGVEGSKPGASVVAAFLSHVTIGLHSSGYGRLLGYANMTCKRIWTELVTMAGENDPFEIVTLQPAPTEAQYRIIKDHILNHTLDEIWANNMAVETLSECGPDLLINAFTVNFKTPILLGQEQEKRVANTSLDDLNEFTKALGEDLDVLDARQIGAGSIVRKRLLMLRSEFSKKSSKAIAYFKKVLRIEDEDSKKSLYHIVSTNLDPWPTATESFLPIFRTELRKSILRCIGQVTDKKHEDEQQDSHSFVLLPIDEEEANQDGGVFYADHRPMFNMARHQYHAIAKFKLTKETMEKIGAALPTPPHSLVVRAQDKSLTLHELLYSCPNATFNAQVWLNTAEKGGEFATLIDNDGQVKVLDVIRFDHFDPAAHHPPQPSYFIYGHGASAYMSHNIARFPDYHHCIKIDGPLPEEVQKVLTPALLDAGVDAFFEHVATPSHTVGMTSPILANESYKVNFIGMCGVAAACEFSFEENEFVHFDSTAINAE